MKMLGRYFEEEYWGWKYDILKLFLSFLVVMLHTYALPVFFEPLLGVAVPLFFIISSYIFWGKISNVDQIPCAITRFVKRNLMLYLFWIVVMLIPITFINRWFCGDVSFFYQLAIIIRDFFFWEVFPASWFLMALPLGMWIISLLVSKLNANNGVLVIVAILSFALCWVDGFSSKPSAVSMALSPIKVVIPYITNSFITSLPYIVIGKLLADSDWDKRYFSWLPILIALLVFLLLFEGTLYEGYYVTTVLLATSIFVLIQQIKEGDKKDLRWIRRTSIIIYCSHKTISILLNTVFRYLEMSELHGMSLFAVTLLMSLLLAWTILLCTTKFNIKWLKYAY